MEENKTNVAEGNATYSEEATIMVAAQSDESQITGEIEALGSGDRRVFDLGDGNFKAVYYPVADDGKKPMQEFSVYSYQGTKNKIGIDGTTARRAYFTMAKPTLVSNPRIKKAELVLRQSDVTQSEENVKLGLYEANVIINNEGEITETTQIYTLIDYLKMKSPTADETVSYAFDITSLIDQLLNGETEKVGFVVKLIDETIVSGNCMIFSIGDSKEAVCPTVEITYESTYSVNTSYRADTHELGRFGRGSVDLMCGNLMLESEDFVWQGNRMPVTIKHLFNSALVASENTRDIIPNTADFSAMNLGKGWRLNIMQSVKPTNFIHDGVLYEGFVYINENGEAIYFKESNERFQNEIECYSIYETIDNCMLYDHIRKKVIRKEMIYTFDEEGHLTNITDKYGNTMSITYELGQIISVTDGAGREFAFDYADGKLVSITAPESKGMITYEYANEFLASITYHTGITATIAYESDKPSTITLIDGEGNVIHKVVYEFIEDRLTSVSEFGVDNAEGAKTQYSYSAAARQMVAQTFEPSDEGETTEMLKRVYTFDEYGNVNSEYMYSETLWNVGTDGGNSNINPNVGGNMSIASNINNLLEDHGFNDLAAWTGEPLNGEDIYISRRPDEKYCMFGKNYMYIRTSNAECSENGVYQIVNTLPIGGYTFSAYIRALYDFTGVNNVGAYIRVTAEDGSILAESEHLETCEKEYIRLIAPFEITRVQNITVHILVNGENVIYVDGAQLENNPYASAYNWLEGGNFDYNADKWYVNKTVTQTVTAADGMQTQTTSVEKTPVGTEGLAEAVVSDEYCFNMSKSLKIVGNLDEKRSVCQDVEVRRTNSTRETFTLSGWAKGYALPVHDAGAEDSPTFRLRAVLYYAKTSEGEKASETFIADFSPCTEGWQFASVEIAKSDFRKLSHAEIYCDYDYNFGDAYFDDIQLVRSSLETNLTQEDFTSTATDDEDETTDETTTDVTDDEAEDSTPTFEEALDAFGNTLTETTFTDGEFGTIYRSFGFSTNGNDLVRETDARGNNTTYTVDAVTSRNQEVIDRLGNKTAYTYDDAGRIIKVDNIAAKRDANGEVIRDENENIQYETTPKATVSYTYDDFDNMTAITRGDGMKYELVYNAFHNLESIGINGKTDGDLIKYTYKNGNGRLKEVAYANGDKMTATYNAAGQLTHETWTNASNVEIARYIYTYDGQGNIVRSIDKHASKEYNYYYEDGRIVRATECDIVMSDAEIVTSKTVVNAIRYTYDSDGNLTKKVITPTGDEPFTYYYETTDDNTVVKFVAGGKNVTCHSKTDSFGRKEFDEIQTSAGFISRQFSYHTGDFTADNKDNEKLKSTPTTQLVSRITLSNGRTLEYEYDAEERITKVVDSEEGTTEYTYDAFGQMLTEKKNGAVINNMVYNSYGNILSKSGDMYFYDSVWKDRLTQISYNETDENGNVTGIASKTITYDAQGNPTNYFGTPMMWEKGRQLKSINTGFYTYNYTYNANGIRTGKAYSTFTCKYTLDGTKILKEELTSGTYKRVITPLYDNEDSVCGIVYNNTPYYFQKNLQGDIIAIVNASGTIVGKYSYDAWGKCTITYQNSRLGVTAANPFRYRGYYYDSETGFYYLQSRYYDPSTGRFVNADVVGFAKITQGNLYSYCNNSPVIYKDELGFSASAFVTIASALAALGVKAYALTVGMYLYSAIGARIDNDINIGSKGNPLSGYMEDRLENSRVVNNRIRLIISNCMNYSNHVSMKEGVSFPVMSTCIKDMDLALSVGNASDFTVTIKRTKERFLCWTYTNYKVTVAISDVYDFDLFDFKSRDVIVTIINNFLGYYPMKLGALKKYNWRFTHKFNY